MTEPILARGRAQHGFSMVELLVVILIVGILAAIALPVFLAQQGKGQDASAKHDARNVAGAMEACFTDGEDYRSCTAPADLRQASVSLGSGRGQVEVAAPGATGVRGDRAFEVRRRLRHGAGGRRAPGAHLHARGPRRLPRRRHLVARTSVHGRLMGSRPHAPESMTGEKSAAFLRLPKAHRP